MELIVCNRVSVFLQYILLTVIIAVRSNGNCSTQPALSDQDYSKDLFLTLRQAVGQLCSTASMAHNLKQCQLLVKEAVAAGARVGTNALGYNFNQHPLTESGSVS